MIFDVLNKLLRRKLTRKQYKNVEEEMDSFMRSYGYRKFITYPPHRPRRRRREEMLPGEVKTIATGKKLK